MESSFVDFLGTQRYFEINAHLFDLNGKNIVLAISRDITERIQAREILEEKNQELRTLLHRASHDLRSPMTNVIGLVNVAKDEVGENIAHESLEKVNKSGEQLLYVIESLGSASLSKKQSIEIEEIDFRALLGDLKE